MCRIILPVILLLSSLKGYSQKINNDHRISYLRYEKLSKASVDSVDVSVVVRNTDSFMKQQRSFHLLRELANNILVVRTRVSNVKNIASSENVIFINELQIPKEELTTGAYDLTLNRINYVHARFPLLSGDSLQSSVKERLFDTLDIDLRGRVFRTGLEATTQTSHAAIMATIISGGANSSPFAKGVAWKSNVSSASFLNLFADPDSVFQKYKISLQNHSYGTTVENFYGNEAMSYDVQSNRLPFLVHVFSAGNSGNITSTSGPYAGISEYANLTGNFKQAKNIITVGSVDSAAQLMPLSSKGPAYDGRVKPEIMAYGEDGSSGAAATVSGAVLLVQNAYKKTHGSILPASSLVKVVLLNSADDIGTPNVDFASGFGSLNAYKAITTINENRYFENAVVQGAVKTYNLTVPAGVLKLKLAIVWNDPAAVPNASKALVNDIDLQLKLPATGASWLPWVLDPVANLSALQSTPQRKVDTLNNIEQITLDQPVAGDYVIEVKGTKISTTDQSFSLAYQFDTTSVFYWTYPTSNDHLISANVQWLRWESDQSGSAQIEYATNGNNWRLAGSVADLSKKYFRWTVPDTVTTAVLRMKVQSTGNIFLSDSFTINPQLNMQVGFNCADSFLLYWNSLPPNSYRLFELGTNYLQPFTQTPDTSVLLNKAQHPGIYYSVAPLVNNKEGIKSYTVNYTTQAGDCYIKSFFLQSQTSSAVYFTAELGSLFRVADVSFEKLSTNGFVPLKKLTGPAILVFNFADSLLNQGENRYRLRVTLSNGAVLYSNVEVVYYVSEVPVFLFPNPVARNSMLKVVTNESGRFTLQIADNNGRIVYRQLLTSTLTQVNAGFFAKGFYVARIYDRDGKPFSQKLVVF